MWRILSSMLSVESCLKLENSTSDHEVEVEVQPDEAARVRHDVGVGIGSGRPLPLNSRKLTGVLLRQLARGLEIPTTSSRDELRTLIEGKLGDIGHDPQNTQAVLQEAETGANISLQDVDGVFLTVKPEKQDDPPGETIEGGDAEGIEELRAALREAKEQQAARDEELARLREQLAKEKERYKKLWSLNCAQLAEFDGAISAKDEEIEQLKTQLRSAGDDASLPKAPPPGMPSEGETEENVPTH